MKVGNIEIIQWWWFSGKETVGIVLGRDEITKEYQYYIGATRLPVIDMGAMLVKINPEDITEEDNVKYIVDWGVKFPKDVFVSEIGELISAIQRDESSRTNN
jgi:hypothetical protein